MMDDSGSLKVRWVQGFPSSTVAFLDENIACYPCGNYIVLLNVETKMRQVLESPGVGIGVFTASGLCKTLAFSEQKLSPSIFVYRYPELSIRCELKGAAKLSYTALALSDTAPYLASCSSLPEYAITIWNLEKGTSVCSGHLAEMDITTLLFNPVTWQQICAKNTKSVTLWNIERFDEVHIMDHSVIDLPDIDGCVVDKENVNSYIPIGKLTYFGPQMPTSAIAGLVRESADHILEKKPRLSPSAICWSVSSDLYIGTMEGFLLLVNAGSLIVSILHNPHNRASDYTESPKIQEGSLRSLALHTKGVFATGSDGVLQTLKIKGNQLEELETLTLVEPVSSLCISPDYETLLLSSSTGHIYKYNPSLKNEVDKVQDVLCGNFIAAASLYTEQNLCVSVRESGELQLWSLEDGGCIASISLPTKPTCLACCPIAQYVAVGTVTGHVLFVDLTRAHKPRLVHSVYLYRLPVEHLVFDQGANFLITGAFHSHIFLLDARPSKSFAILGYTDAVGATVGLSTQYQAESKQVDVLVLCNSEKNKTDKGYIEGNLIMLMSVSTQQISETADCVDDYGRLQEQVVQTCVYELPHTLTSCVLVTKTVYGYCHQMKVLQRFQLPKKMSRHQKTARLSPNLQVEGHPLGPALLSLSPVQAWLASFGRDGLIRIHDITTLERFVQKQCHSWWLGGIRSVSFTPNSQTLITTGFQDGSLVCSSLSLKMAAATQDSLPMVDNVEDKIFEEFKFLSVMADWVPPQILFEGRNRSQVTTDIMQINEGSNSVSSTTSCNYTWIDNKLNTVLKKESQQFAENRNNLKNIVAELQNTIHDMMQENDNLPDIEKLEQLEFNLDMDMEQKLQAMGEKEVTKVRKEIELENLGKCYLQNVLKKKYWDSMDVKGKAIEAFHSGIEVDNFPMKERTAKELQELNRVETLQAHTSERVLRNSMAPLQADEDNEMESLTLTGSLSAQYGASNFQLYSQFSLHTWDLKLQQIILIQDVIYKVKTAFNTQFEAVHKQKEQEISRIKEKNKRITEIMGELELQESLWEPTLSKKERPERALTVLDSEIKVEKYLTPEQKKREEQQRKEEEQKRIAAKGDNIRERALDDMMGGVLEVKKVDILRMEVPPPEFLAKPDIQWTEEEKKSYKEYDKKVKELKEEKEKYRKTLEAEIKKLHTSIKDSTQAFDETLSKLFERKVKSKMVIYQEELKITNLVYSLLIEEEMLNREEQLVSRQENVQTVKNQIGKMLKKYRKSVEAFRETYDNTVAEDKLLDSGFRREFNDVPGHIVDQLSKLYKRRPRIQIMRTQTGKASSIKEPSLLSQSATEGLSQMMKAMEELDAPHNMPESLDPAVWDRFCLVRRTKMESEHKVKMNALTLAEMQTFLQKRVEDEENAQTELKNIVDSLNCLRKDRSRFCLNVMVQMLLKQGQVEVETGDFTADYSDSLLLYRSVVDDLNITIRAVGEQKVASMIECKDLHKGIIQQEWDLKRISMKIEDLKNKARDIQMLHMSPEIQEYLIETDHDSRMSKKVSTLEKTMTLQQKIYSKNVESCKKLIKDLKKQAKVKTQNNAALDLQLINMQVTVAERRNIFEATAIDESQDLEAKQRYENILQRKNLVELVKAQDMDIAILSAELECMRMKTFPAFS